MKKLIFLFLHAALLYCHVHAQPHPEAGLPFISNISPKEYGASGANWAIVKDDRGVMYFGNSSGLLEYDGATWRLILLPNQSTVRSLAKAEDGTIYVGGVGDFGFLAADSLGQMQFVSLLSEAPQPHRQFGDVWHTHILNDAIYFSTDRALYRWRPGETSPESTGVMHVWPSGQRYHVSAIVHGQLYARRWGIGLMRMENDSLVLVPGGERFADERIYVMLPFETAADSEGNPPKSPFTKGGLSVPPLDKEDTSSVPSSDKAKSSVLGGIKKMLIGTRSQGLFVYDGQTFQPFKTEADEILAQHALYLPGAVLADGSFALGTLGGGMIVIDHAGRLLSVLDQAAGLADDEVMYVYPDPSDTGLWLGLFNGIAYVETPSPLSLYSELSGLAFPISDVTRYQQKLYVATNRGIFWLDDRGAFRLVPGTVGQCFDLLLADDGLYATVLDKGVVRIEGARSIPVRRSVNYDFRANTLLQWQRNPDYLFVQLDDALAVLNRRDGRWQDVGKVAMQSSVFSIVEDADGSIWLGSATSGLVRLQLRQRTALDSAALQAAPVDYFDGQHGLPQGLAVPYRIADHLYFVTLAGAYRFDTASTRFHADSAFAEIGINPRTGSFFPMTEDARGRIWLSFGAETAVATPNDDGAYTIDKTPFLRFADSPPNVIYPEEDGTVWFGGSEALIRYDSSVPKEYATDYPALIRRVSVGADSVVYGGAMAQLSEASKASESLVLSHSHNTLRFEYAAATYDNPKETRFQTLLEGFDREWSVWNPKTEKEYTNLPQGSYRFRVRASNIYQHPSREAAYAFEILPPWWRTWWAYLLYLLTGGGLVFGLVRIRTHQLEANKRELEQTVKARTAEIQQRVEELAVINSVQEGLVRELDMQAIYDMIGDQIREIFDAQAVIIGIFDHHNNLEKHAYNIEKGERIYTEPRPIDQVRRHLIEKAEPVLINENLLDAVAREFGIDRPEPVPGTEMPKSALWVPLVVGETVKGYVSLQNIDREHAFSDSDVRLLTTLANSMSVALENARLFDETNRLLKETEQRNAELGVINSVQEGLVRELDMQAIYDLVGDRVCELFDTQTVLIRTFDHETGLEHWQYVMEKGERLHSEPRRFIWANKELIKTRQPLVINENYVETSKKYGGKGVSFGKPPKSAVFVPLIVSEVVRGSISLQNIDREHAFSDAEVRLLTTLANSMSVALENARLFNEANQRAVELATVNDISRALVSQLEFDALLHMVGENMRTTFKADIVYVARLDKTRNMVDFPYVYGDDLSSIPYGEGWASQIIRSGEPLLINRDLTQKHEELGVKTIGTPAASYIGVPVPAGDEIIGVISVQSTQQENRFNENDMRLLSTIAANVGVAMQNAESYRKLNKALEDLKATQDKLVTQEKLASLGALTAGIAHEIKNPLNFVNNFAELSKELVEELQQEIATWKEESGNGERLAEIDDILADLKQNAVKINEHGKRADSIVRSMLQHSRGKKGERQPTDLNAILEEDINLAYHGMRAQDSSFNVTIEKDFDASIGEINAVPQDISRVFLNIITNGFYATHQKKSNTPLNPPSRGDLEGGAPSRGEAKAGVASRRELEAGVDFSPTLSVRTENKGNSVEVRIRDNGNGIPAEIRDKLFNPFFTTKPTGQGTGLGLSISYEIIAQEHEGQITFESEEGEFTEFIITLPKDGKA